jgi:hypothetical protein
VAVITNQSKVKTQRRKLPKGGIHQGIHPAGCDCDPLSEPWNWAQAQQHPACYYLVRYVALRSLAVDPLGRAQRLVVSPQLSSAHEFEIGPPT